MSTVINKKMTRQQVENMMQKLARRKQLDAKKFSGTVKWNEDALTYQKRMRNEWN